MKNLVISALIFFSLNAYAAHHEESDLGSNNYQLISTYEIAYGQNPQVLSKWLQTYQKNQESFGYNNCGVYQHEFGAPRSFYTYCNFDDFGQFAEIMKKSNAAPNTSSRQNFASHSDNFVSVIERNLTEAPNYLLYSKFIFGPYLTATERGDRAKKLFNLFQSSFKACNLAQHKFGPEIAFYISYGFSDYSDFAKKQKIQSELNKKEYSDINLDIKDHSDNILVLIMD